MDTNRKFIVMAIMAILSIIIIVGVTVSYFIDKKEKSNEFSIGYNTIEIVEDFKPPEELKAGVEFTKDVKIKNTGASECYVRVKAVFTNEDMKPLCDIDINTVDYDYNEEDGYYYYKHSINIDDCTNSLFTKVKIKDDAKDIKPFDILIYAESYQSRGFNDYKSAWDNFNRNKPHN